MRQVRTVGQVCREGSGLEAWKGRTRIGAQREELVGFGMSHGSDLMIANTRTIEFR